MRLSRSVIALALTAGLVAPLTTGSASATTTGHAAHLAAKRGVAAMKYLKTHPDKLSAAGAGWSYNWTYRVPDSSAGLDVVPMIRTSRSLTTAAVHTLAAAHRSGVFKYLLGFNEPDHKNQANLTPTQAANLWPKLQATGLTLGSPAPALSTNGWLKQFMAIATKRHLRVDFIALHFYARITDPRAVSRIKTQLDLIHRHYGKPIWITELGLTDLRADSGNGASPRNWATATKFMRSITSVLDKLPYVQRYAWMADNVSTASHLRWSSLYDSTGRLTPLGVAYRNL